MNYNDPRNVRVLYATRLQVVPVTKDIDFELPDYKGRAIGYHYRIDAVDVTVVTPEMEAAQQAKNGWGFACYLATPEQAACSFLYRLASNVTRNGERFGAGHGFEYFLSFEAAKKEVTKKMEAARKRYARQPQEKR